MGEYTNKNNKKVVITKLAENWYIEHYKGKYCLAHRHKNSIFHITSVIEDKVYCAKHDCTSIAPKYVVDFYKIYSFTDSNATPLNAYDKKANRRVW